MSDFTNVSRPGQINGAGDPRALYLTKFANEVLVSLPQMIDTMDIVMHKTLRGGKDYTFPFTGKLSAKYHVAGTQLDGQVTNQNERKIGLDDLLVSDRFVPKIDEFMKHYDDRAPYVAQMAESLAVVMDKNNFAEAILGARVSAPLVTGNTTAVGTVITDDNFQIGIGGSADSIEQAQAIKGAIKTFASELKKKNVSANRKKCLYIGWDLYYNVLDAVDTNGFSFFNKDYTSGSMEQGMMPVVYGINIKGSNNIHTSDLSAIADPQAVDGEFFYHKGDFSQTIGVLICQDAVALVKASDITIEVDPYRAREKGQLMTADYLAGAGWLRAECLGELELDLLFNP